MKWSYLHKNYKRNIKMRLIWSTYNNIKRELIKVKTRRKMILEVTWIWSSHQQGVAILEGQVITHQIMLKIIIIQHLKHLKEPKQQIQLSIAYQRCHHRWIISLLRLYLKWIDMEWWVQQMPLLLSLINSGSLCRWIPLKMVSSKNLTWI